MKVQCRKRPRWLEVGDVVLNKYGPETTWTRGAVRVRWDGTRNDMIQCDLIRDETDAYWVGNAAPLAEGTIMRWEWFQDRTCWLREVPDDCPL